MGNDSLIRNFNRQAKYYEIRRRRKTQHDWRSRLLQSAKGDTLEIAVGAGANLVFYPPDVRLTAVDFSPNMLAKAKVGAQEAGMSVNFVLSDVESLDFPDNSFDTVVSTLSLCGYDHPNRLLAKLNQWCRSTGRILLMEHGISANSMMAVGQKLFDPLAYKLIGCHQNRDIMQLIREAKLVVEKEEHHRLDSIHLIWARPNKL